MGRPRGRRKGGIDAGDMVIEGVTTDNSCGFPLVGYDIHSISSPFGVVAVWFAADGIFPYHVILNGPEKGGLQQTGQSVSSQGSPFSAKKRF